MFKNINIKPALTLAVITTLISALLIFANVNLKPDGSTLSGTLLEKCISTMGQGNYEIVSDWLEAGYLIKKPDGIDKLIKKDDGTTAFQIYADGYEKNGLNMLIVMNGDGSIKNVSFVSITETPGLGTKVDNESFIDNFIGLTETVNIVKSLSGKGNEIQAITGATYSSKGVAKGINLAISVYKEMGTPQ